MASYLETANVYERNISAAEDPVEIYAKVIEAGENREDRGRPVVRVRYTWMPAGVPDVLSALGSGEDSGKTG